MRAGHRGHQTVAGAPPREAPINTVERSFRLEARSGLGAKPRPELIGPVLTHLHETLQDTVRMGFLHTSRARGRIPGSIKAAVGIALEPGFPRIGLINGRQLVDLLIEHWGDIPPEFRERLGLKPGLVRT